MPRVAKRGRRGAFPHAHYGVDLVKVSDMYIEPFTAYRVWNWKVEGITSLNGALWTPKETFEAKCPGHEDIRSMQAASGSPEAAAFWNKQAHNVPDTECTCGLYAGINMQHMIDTHYIQRGIHGEVSLWGRLIRHTLGWRAQFAYPKYFVVPANMVPFRMADAKMRLDSLAEFGVDIFLQPENEAKVGQKTIPLWMPDYGYTTQGLEWLIEKRKEWYAEHPKTHTLAVGDRVAVFTRMACGSGIGVVQEIRDGEMHYKLFSPDTVYRKPVKDIVWNERNWRWETTGVGSVAQV
jgi:hypothetical protein